MFGCAMSRHGGGGKDDTEGGHFLFTGGPRLSTGMVTPFWFVV